MDTLKFLIGRINSLFAINLEEDVETARAVCFAELLLIRHVLMQLVERNGDRHGKQETVSPGTHEESDVSGS